MYNMPRQPTMVNNHCINCAQRLLGGSSIAAQRLPPLSLSRRGFAAKIEKTSYVRRHGQDRACKAELKPAACLPIYIAGFVLFSFLFFICYILCVCCFSLFIGLFVCLFGLHRSSFLTRGKALLFTRCYSLLFSAFPTFHKYTHLFPHRRFLMYFSTAHLVY